VGQSIEPRARVHTPAVSAERVPLEMHLKAMSSDERKIWDRFVELVEAAGPSEMIVTKSRIAFRAANRIFAGGFFKSRRLELFFDLAEPVPEQARDERFRQVWEQGPRLWTHRLKIEGVDELDETLGAWLADSHATYSKPPGDR
jgi:hypothetical protein